MKHPCPNCGTPLVSGFRKSLIASVGPLSRIECTRCGTKVGVPFLLSTAFNMLVIVAPWFAGWLALQLLPNPSSPAWAALAFFVAFIGSMVVMLWLYVRHVPLVSKDITRSSE